MHKNKKSKPKTLEEEGAANMAHLQHIVRCIASGFRENFITTADFENDERTFNDRTLTFANRIPGFNDLSQLDKNLLCELATTRIGVIVKAFHAANGGRRFCDADKQQKPKIAAYFKKLVNVAGLRDPLQVENIQEQCLEALHVQVQASTCRQSNVFAKLLITLSEAWSIGILRTMENNGFQSMDINKVSDSRQSDSSPPPPPVPPRNCIGYAEQSNAASGSFWSGLQRNAYGFYPYQYGGWQDVSFGGYQGQWKPPYVLPYCCNWPIFRAAQEGISPVLSMVSAVAETATCLTGLVDSVFYTVNNVVTAVSCTLKKLGTVAKCWLIIVVQLKQQIERALIFCLSKLCLRHTNFDDGRKKGRSIGKSRSDGIDVVLFVISISGMLLLLSKLWQLLRSLLRPSKWMIGEGEHYKAVALYKFEAVLPSELSFEVGQMLKIAPKEKQPAIRGWLLATSDGKNSGLVPANYIKIIDRVQQENGKKILTI
ncbi:unnamed protein product [Soboliphyme baturini]|uniref:Peroxin-13 n=1 Tax=Soboliphyme baturini TaxID=241478 RepID=A0A183IS73_9BILA|nr:unnamed protein product [Soboliphyme baturini]